MAHFLESRCQDGLIHVEDTVRLGAGAAYFSNDKAGVLR